MLLSGLGVHWFQTPQLVANKFASIYHLSLVLFGVPKETALPRGSTPWL